MTRAAAPFAGRIARLRDALGRKGPGAVLVTHLPNVRWLCGFTGSAGSLLVTPREAVFFTDYRYRAQAREEVRGARRVEYASGRAIAVAAEVRRARVRRLGFEAENLSVAGHGDLRAALSRGTRLVPLRGTVERLRAVKDAVEIAAIRAALSIARRALGEVAGDIAGARESDIAEGIRSAMRRLGAEGEAFPPIVASGPRGALPHAVPTRRRVRGGDMVVVDFGAKVGGYCCDVTRTLRARKWDGRSAGIYATVLSAQKAAFSKIGPGVKAADVDAAARQVIERAGYGKAFGHGTGHGVGLEVHEGPTISARSGDILLPGMVFTVEPGIYLEKLGGVRIEDMVLVTESGCEVLSRGVPKLLDP